MSKKAVLNNHEGAASAEERRAREELTRASWGRVTSLPLLKRKTVQQRDLTPTLRGSTGEEEEDVRPVAVDVAWLRRSDLGPHQQLWRGGVLVADVDLEVGGRGVDGGYLSNVPRLQHARHVRVLPVGDLHVPAGVDEAGGRRQAAVDDVQTMEVFHSGGDVG